MKAKIHGIDVEGTPDEITRFKTILETQTSEIKIKTPIIKWYEPSDVSKSKKWSIGTINC